MIYLYLVLAVALVVGGAALFKHRADLKAKAKAEEDAVLARIAQQAKKL